MNFMLINTRTYAGQVVGINQKSFDVFERRLIDLIKSSENKNKSLSIKGLKMIDDSSLKTKMRNLIVPPKFITKNPEWDAYFYLSNINSDDNGMCGVTPPLPIDTGEIELIVQRNIWKSNWENEVEKSIKNI